MAVEDHRRLELFFKLWTLKESYIKATGKGLSRPLNTFSFDLTSGVPALDSGLGEDEGEYFCKLFDWDRHYQVAVCSRSALIPDAIEKIEMVSFCNEMLEHPAD
jgi:4'-phosphopantetheinyl transferase